jgi:hypothetical protein
MSEENIPSRQHRRLTVSEKTEKIHVMIEEIDDFICESIQYCDDPQDLIAIGSFLQVISKNILTSALGDKQKWAASITQYALDTLEHDVNDRIPRGEIPVEAFKGIYY